LTPAGERSLFTLPFPLGAARPSFPAGELGGGFLLAASPCRGRPCSPLMLNDPSLSWASKQLPSCCCSMPHHSRSTFLFDVAGRGCRSSSGPCVCQAATRNPFFSGAAPVLFPGRRGFPAPPWLRAEGVGDSFLRRRHVCSPAALRRSCWLPFCVLGAHELVPLFAILSRA